MSFCSNCGTEYQEGRRFCSSSGQRISSDPATTASPVASSDTSTKVEENTIWESKPAGLKARAKGQFNATTYILTNLRLIIRTGLVRKKVEQIELIRVKDLELIHGLKDRSLGGRRYSHSIN
ncbi:MAG: PH domain-containing protein [Methanotrichaceae archaeon]|nr:PH domain-containing protein [Methanotrichaceae archaeon]